MIIPFADNVLCEAIDDPSMSKGGIVIATESTASKSRPVRARVLAVGEGKIDERGVFREVDVSVGDIVYFEDYAPFKIKEDGKEYLLITEQYLLAKEKHHEG